MRGVFDVYGKKPLISIIVPFYNVERYLKQCLESILNQTYHNLEIVLVNDGSTDRSQNICDQYMKRDNRVKVFYKTNGGLSDARNFGIEHSKGEYFLFVDSDDRVDPDYVEFLWLLLENGKYKMSMCSLYVKYTDNNRIISRGNGKKEILSGKRCIEKMCYHDEVDACAVAKLMHRDLFRDIRFPEGKLFEDIGAVYLLFDKSKKVACGFEPKYYYCVRPDSIVTSTFNMGKLDMLVMTDQMAAFVDAKYPDLKAATMRRQVYARFSTLNQMAQVTNMDEIKKELISFIKAHAKEVLYNKKTPKRDKVAIISLCLNYRFYRWLWCIYLKLQRG